MGAVLGVLLVKRRPAGFSFFSTFFRGLLTLLTTRSCVVTTALLVRSLSDSAVVVDLYRIAKVASAGHHRSFSSLSRTHPITVWAQQLECSTSQENRVNIYW